MKPQNLPSIILDADPILRRFGLPYWALAQIRNLRVGEDLLLVDFEAPGFMGSTGSVGASITRERGGLYRLEAGWLAHLGKNAQRRGHLWSWVYLKLLPGRKLELVQVSTGEDVRRQAFRLVETVLRRATILAMWAKRDGARGAYRALSPDFFMNRHETSADAMSWLEKLRGPALVSRGEAAGPDN